MPASIATVPTDRPERYIKQLVTHLGHRLVTEVDEAGVGRITRGESKATLTPATGAIEMTVVAPDAESLATLKDVVGRHLVRFGTGDELVVEWQDADAQRA